MPENRKADIRTDPRSPFVVNVREFGHQPGVERRYRRSVSAPADLGLELIGVPVGEPLELDLRLEAVREGVYLSGTAYGRLKGQCGRCLDPFESELSVQLRELFAFPDSLTVETTDEDETSRLTDDLVDVEPVLRDAVVLALPTNPVCQPDCEGLCAGCGARWEDLADDHTHEQLDPRWEALRGLAGQPAESTEQRPTEQRTEQN